MYLVGGNFQQAKFWVISKAAMIAGNIVGQFSTFDNGVGNGFTWQPCHSFDVAAGSCVCSSSPVLGRLRSWPTLATWR
jgi:hypothetical protein